MLVTWVELIFPYILFNIIETFIFTKFDNRKHQKVCVFNIFFKYQDNILSSNPGFIKASYF